jgi:TPR repeat protein
MRPLLLVLVVTACGPSPSTTTTLPPAAATTPTPTPVDAPPPAETEPECGDADACLAAAKSLDASDPAAATEAFYGACIGGSVEGCEQAGLRWQKDLDPKADSPLNAKIIDAFDRSCTLGGGKHGCGNVGLAYFYGIRGLSVDVDKALQYMKKACDVDENKLVCRRLEMYEKGEAKPGVLPQ